MASRLGRTRRKRKRPSKAARIGDSKKRKSHFKRPTTARQYFRLAPKDREMWDSIGHVITRMRDGVSLPKASKEFGIAPSTIVELGRPALVRRTIGQLRQFRPMIIVQC
jgi:hypothetical protein